MESSRVSCVWLLPLSIMFSGLIYAVACLHHNFILFSDCIIFRCMMDHIWLIHSLVSGWFLTILNCEHSSICSSLWSSVLWEDKLLLKTPTVPSNACSSERLRLSLSHLKHQEVTASQGKHRISGLFLWFLRSQMLAPEENGERQFATAYYLDL